MKLKSTLGLAIGSLLAVSSFGVFAQGQGAVEAEVFAKRYFTDSYRSMDDGNLYGGSVGYFLTDDVSLNLSYGEYKSLNHDSYMDGGVKQKSKKANGSLSSLDAVYHFGTPGVGLRPFVSAGMGHQSLNQAQRSGRDHTTFANIGAGAKYYFTENLFAKASVDGVHGFDNHQSEWMAGVGVGVNFGGKPAAAPYVEPVAPAPVEPVVYEEVEAEPVRVELDVKFDFDKSNVKQDSYSDIENLAEFMKQYPQTATTVEGHTDSVGNAAYNQKLSERRASAVRDTLVNQYGVEADRINAVGYGKERPVADNATSEGRAINRRVEASVEAQPE
ncbi:MAG TPA: OmpA family protein [Gammaproteobacteria bacterium]|nr:OmpA family protein [Gammaproteobacteria bacterium]